MRYEVESEKRKWESEQKRRMKVVVAIPQADRKDSRGRISELKIKCTPI